MRKPRISGLLERRRARWEAACLRCGRCCYEKEIRGITAVTNYHKPCRYLDTGTRLCTVYEKRFTACLECRRMTLAHALFTRWLPSECGYVVRYRPWRRRAAAGGGTGQGARETLST